MAVVVVVVLKEDRRSDLKSSASDKLRVISIDNRFLNVRGVSGVEGIGREDKVTTLRILLIGGIL